MRSFHINITKVARHLSQSKSNFVKKSLVNIIDKMYPGKLDTNIVDNFACFDDFFTRDFQPGERQISEGVINPVDGLITEINNLNKTHPIYVKHKKYSPKDLLPEGNEFISENSNYISYYLAPFNNHQVYMPANGEIISTVYMPAMLHSVRPGSKNIKDILATKNERLIFYIESEFGRIVLVMIGALLVGSISTAWGKRFTPNKSLDIQIDKVNKVFSKGQSIARFHYGSSVILITEKCLLKDHLGKDCLMGQTISIK